MLITDPVNNERGMICTEITEGSSMYSAEYFANERQRPQPNLLIVTELIKISVALYATVILIATLIRYCNSHTHRHSHKILP